MTLFPADRDTSGDPFAEVGDPVLAVADKRRGMVAVAGAHEYDEAKTVGVFHVTDRARRRWLLSSQYPVNAMAFHPTLPLLAVGSGEYDGGYHFEGELLLVHLETGTTLSLIEHHLGRQILGLEWLNHQDLRVLMAPPDDWEDRKAHVEGHVAVVRRADWTVVGAKSLTGRDLAGPRVPAPRPDHREAARQAVARLVSPRTRRHHSNGTHA
ncbi:hypothetical protein [Kitasatospora herbaricolor]|uniref:Uncharacterized protein n=1 Tax=Kitasatospora herbaricolor TaxID=68217 RepID=A0ABZ1WJD5_9ACTN|nr:hypothetical protein [Kitasatospora herbaricolor]